MQRASSVYLEVAFSFISVHFDLGTYLALELCKIHHKIHLYGLQRQFLLYLDLLQQWTVLQLQPPVSICWTQLSKHMRKHTSVSLLQLGFSFLLTDRAASTVMCTRNGTSCQDPTEQFPKHEFLHLHDTAILFPCPCFSADHPWWLGWPCAVTLSSAQALQREAPVGTDRNHFIGARWALEVEGTGLTWDTRLSTLQPWASSSHFMGSSLAERPHGELEGAAWHGLPSVFDIHRVDPHFLRHKADTVGVFVNFYYFCIGVSSRGTSYLGRHVPTVNF